MDMRKNGKEEKGRKREGPPEIIFEQQVRSTEVLCGARMCFVNGQSSLRTGHFGSNDPSVSLLAPPQFVPLYP